MENYDYAAIRATSLQILQTVITGYVNVVRTGGKIIDFENIKSHKINVFKLDNVLMRNYYDHYLILAILLLLIS